MEAPQPCQGAGGVLDSSARVDVERGEESGVGGKLSEVDLDTC